MDTFQKTEGEDSSASGNTFVTDEEYDYAMSLAGEIELGTSIPEEERLDEADLFRKIEDDDDCYSYDAVKEEQKRAEEHFKSLPMLEHLKQLMEAKGIHSKDPLFAFVEVVDLFDERLRKTLLQQVSIAEKSDLLYLALVQEFKRASAEISKANQNTERLLSSQCAVLETMQALNVSQKKLLEDLPPLYESTRSAIQILGEMGKHQWFLNMLVPAVSICVGMLGMAVVFWSLGMLKL